MAKKKRKEPASAEAQVETPASEPVASLAASEPATTEAETTPAAFHQESSPPSAEEPTKHWRSQYKNDEPPPQDNPYPDPSKPFSIAHHNGAGVRLLKFPRFKQVQLRFEREVPSEVQQQLEQDHWKFRPEEGVYTKQYGVEGEAAAIVQSRRFFVEICRGSGSGLEGARNRS